MSVCAKEDSSIALIKTNPYKRDDQLTTWIPKSVNADLRHEMAPLPAPRVGHTLTFDAATKCCVLFGGASTEEGFYNDIFKLDLSKPTSYFLDGFY